MLSMVWIAPFFFVDNQGTFYDQTLRTLYGDPNPRVLTAPQQPTLGKFRVLSVTKFEPTTMCHLLGQHFPVFALTTNWATLTGKYGMNCFNLGNVLFYMLIYCQ